MASFFPRNTHELHLLVEEPKAFRRLSFSLVEMALLTGVVLRLFRSVALTHGSNSWLYFGGTFALGIILLCGMATLHLANYPLRRWTWRAPLFAVVEVVGEMATSYLLIWVGREPQGTGRAELHDWVGMTWSALWTRGVMVCVWALLLAAIVSLVRRTIVASDLHEKHKREHDAGLR